MQWLCYDESETFIVEAATREDAVKLAARYDGVVAGPSDAKASDSRQCVPALACCA